MSGGREISSEIVADDLVKNDACTRAEAAGKGRGKCINRMHISCNLVLKK